MKAPGPGPGTQLTALVSVSVVGSDHMGEVPRMLRRCRHYREEKVKRMGPA